MRKNNIFTFLDEVEKNDETLKKWGDLYRIEESIIENIIKTRKNKGLSQKQLAEKTGLKQPAIARIENNVNSPQLDTLIKIVDALDLTIEIKSTIKTEIPTITGWVDNLDDKMNSFYARVFSNFNSDLYPYQGGLKDEHKSYKYPCNENHPAW